MESYHRFKQEYFLPNSVVSILLSKGAFATMKKYEPSDLMVSPSQFSGIPLLTKSNDPPKKMYHLPY